jgi:hypothetical protein
MGQAFKIYRIVCTLTGKAFVSGSANACWANHPSRAPHWHERGSWSHTGAFFKTENTIRRHLLNLCFNWSNRSNWDAYKAGREKYFRTWTVRPTAVPPDYSRLQYLRVEQIYVSDYATTTLLASDFMGIPAEASPPEKTETT